VTVVLAASSSTKTTTANPIVSLLPLVLIFGLAYVFFLRPRAQAARRQRDTLMELSPGDEVLTGAGIFGTVLDVEADRVTLETAPGTRITVLRSTIARKLGDPADQAPSWDEHDEDEAHGAYHEYEHDHPDEHDEHDGGEEGGTGPDDEHDDPDAPDEHDADDEHTSTDEHDDKKSADGPEDHKP
jgi:preprotein translocase subunit YajC